MEPTLIERECGGWLAVAPPGTSPAIAVTGESAEAAQREFGLSWEAWQALLAQASQGQS